MSRPIESVAVLGAGTMGSGIAALCAEAGCRVVLLDTARTSSSARSRGSPRDGRRCWTIRRRPR